MNRPALEKATREVLEARRARYGDTWPEAQFRNDKARYVSGLAMTLARLAEARVALVDMKVADADVAVADACEAAMVNIEYSIERVVRELSVLTRVLTR